LRLARIRCPSGLTTGVAVLDAQATLASAATRTISVHNDLQTAVVELLQAICDLGS
jgi:outer membrane protein TolC